MRLYFYLLCTVIGYCAASQTSSLVSLNNGSLSYTPFAMEGQTNAVNTIPDFSHAGYMGGGVALPEVPVQVVVSPGSGDDRLAIQNAIDAVAAMTPDVNGFRGAILLTAGTYEVNGQLYIQTSGIVLRGEGQGTNGTVLRANNLFQHEFISILGSGSLAEQSSTAQNITTSYVPVGSHSFEVADASGFTIGDTISVKRTPNQAWIEALGMDDATLCATSTNCVGWTPSSYTIKHERVITGISANTLTVNLPIVDVIEDAYGGGVVAKASWQGRIKQCGVENLRIESAFSSDTDENHAWSAVFLDKTQNCWVKKVTAQYLAYATVNLDDASFTTVQDCAYLDPKSQITGGRRYSFAIQKGIGNLFQRCYASEGRHDFVVQSRVTGPNVFLDGLAENTNSDIGPHQRWATGTLFDNIEGGQMRAWNRGTSGTGHGWAGAQTLFWNCESVKDDFRIESPPGAKNWAIGCTGLVQNGGGFYESWNQHVLPRSLYIQQLEDRMGTAAVALVTTPEQRDGTIQAQLKAWAGNGTLGQTYTYVVEEWNFDGGNTVSESGGINASFLSAGSSDSGVDDQLHVDRTDGAQSYTSSLPGISAGKINVYVTISDFDLEMNPANLGNGRIFGVRLLSGSAIHSEVRLFSFTRDFGAGIEPGLRLGGASSGGVTTTTTNAGFPYRLDKSTTSITYGMTIDMDANTYSYWINSPTDDGSTWAAGPFSGAEGAFTYTGSLDGIRLLLDHGGVSGGGDTPLASNYLNLDRILILHESSTAPATAASLAAATEDEAVTISANETTTASARVQGLTVNSGVTLTVAAGHELTVIGDLVVNGSLVIQDGGSLKTFDYTNVTGNITKQRSSTFSTTDGKYSLVGAPISNADTDDLGNLTYKYNESDETFTQVTTAEAMAVGDGYFAANLGDASFVGTPNTSDVSVTLSTAVNGWNCVANPYPTALNLYSFATGNPNITGSIYLWDDGGSNLGARTSSDYIVVTASGTATAGSSRSADFDGYIRSEQGFFVQASAAGNLVFNDVMRAGAAANTKAGFFRTAEEKALLRVFLSNTSMTADMVLEVNERATSGFDRLYDASVINSGKALNIFSFIEEDAYAIQGLAKEDLYEEVWLGIDIAEAGSYTLDFENNIEGLYLKDHETGIVVDLGTQNRYAFVSGANKIAEKRFSVSANQVLSETVEITEDLFRAYVSEANELVVLSKEGLQHAEISIHDLNGRLIYREANISSTDRAWKTSINNLSEGVLIVNVSNQGNKESIKIVKY